MIPLGNDVNATNDLIINVPQGIEPNIIPISISHLEEKGTMHQKSMTYKT